MQPVPPSSLPTNWEIQGCHTLLPSNLQLVLPHDRPIIKKFKMKTSLTWDLILGEGARPGMCH